jgi:ubiquinone/menaquinone biosynthesis C-methylase UbiE
VRRHPFVGRWNHNAHHYPRLRALLPRDAERVLDVGCGEGTLVRHLAERVPHVVGLDTDLAALRVAASPDVLVGSAESLPFPDGCFDAVTACMVLHHADPEVALGEMTRVLAPGGRLLVLGYARSTPGADLLHEVRDVVAHRYLSRRTTPWDPPTTRANPTHTWAETAALTADLLPGRTWRRLPLWRYLVTWDKPAA